MSAPEPEVFYTPVQLDVLNWCRCALGLEPIEGIRIYPEDIEDDEDPGSLAPVSKEM